MSTLLRPGTNGATRTRYIGVSNLNQSQLEDILAVPNLPKPKTHQFELHPYLQQSSFLAFHKSVDVPVTAYAPLGNTSPFYAAGQLANPTRPPALVRNPVLVDIGRQRNCSAAQVALAWNLGRGVAVIPKAAQRAHQVENVAAAREGACGGGLGKAEVERIEEVHRRYSARVNNPCVRLGVQCFAGLMLPNQGV
jgi:alcohol dehydrogenase (NADP+)